MEILTPFTGEIFVLAMLVILNGRIFFTRRTRHDALAILAPLSIFVMLLQIMAWGIHFAEIVIFALTLIATILNYRSIVRFSQGLFVDSYSLKFFISSLLLLLVAFFLLVANIFMSPINLQTYRYNVKVEREYFSCDFLHDSELKKSVEIQDKRNFTLYTFSNKDESAQKDTIILFVPDVRAETLNYEPYLILLARAGYTILCADLYDNNFSKIQDLKKTKIVRRFLILWNEFKDSDFKNLDAERERKRLDVRAADFEKIYDASYNALASIAKAEYADKGIFVVSDSSSFLTTEKIDAIFAKHFSVPDARAFPRSLNLAEIAEYATPGFGFVAQTNPIFAKLFLGVERDKTSFAPSYCVLQTRRIIGD